MKWRYTEMVVINPFLDQNAYTLFPILKDFFPPEVIDLRAWLEGKRGTNLSLVLNYSLDNEQRKSGNFSISYEGNNDLLIEGRFHKDKLIREYRLSDRETHYLYNFINGVPYGKFVSLSNRVLTSGAYIDGKPSGTWYSYSIPDMFTVDVNTLERFYIEPVYFPEIKETTIWTYLSNNGVNEIHSATFMIKNEEVSKSYIKRIIYEDEMSYRLIEEGIQDGNNVWLISSSIYDQDYTCLARITYDPMKKEFSTKDYTVDELREKKVRLLSWHPETVEVFRFIRLPDGSQLDITSRKGQILSVRRDQQQVFLER